MFVSPYGWRINFLLHPVFDKPVCLCPIWTKKQWVYTAEPQQQRSFLQISEWNRLVALVFSFTYLWHSASHLSCQQWVQYMPGEGNSHAVRWNQQEMGSSRVWKSFLQPCSDISQLCHQCRVVGRNIQADQKVKAMIRLFKLYTHAVCLIGEQTQIFL